MGLILLRTVVILMGAMFVGTGVLWLIAPDIMLSDEVGGDSSKREGQPIADTLRFLCLLATGTFLLLTPTWLARKRLLFAALLTNAIVCACIITIVPLLGHDLHFALAGLVLLGVPVALQCAFVRATRQTTTSE
ncbi:MAG: hypothetical protein ABIP94_07730 [Planctomycetota bacterium]